MIAVDVSARLKKESSVTTGLQVILRSDLVSQDRLKRYDLNMADLVITPQVQSVHWVDFGKIKFCIKRGLDAAANALETTAMNRKPEPWWRRFLRFRGPGAKPVE